MRKRIILLNRSRVVLLFLPLMLMAQPVGAPRAMAQSEDQNDQKDPALVLRPAQKRDIADRRIELEVLVTDRNGRPVTGLEAKDFTLLDNKRPQSLTMFDVTAAGSQRADAPVVVILVLDAVNDTFQQTAIARLQVHKFLRQDGGHLPYPTTIAVFSGEGLRIQQRPSVDGNALSELLDHANAGDGLGATASGAYGEVERFQLSVKTLASIAENEVKKPGRKMLIWIGSGWPLLAGTNFASSERDRQRTFDAIVELSTRLREAHIALYAVPLLDAAKGGIPRMPLPTSNTVVAASSAEGPPAPRTISGDRGAVEGSGYREFLEGVKSAKRAEPGNLALQVLAVESGGRALNPSNDVTDQIGKCLADLGSFYTLSFDPPRAEHADEYHELKVLLNQRGLTAHTNTGYYDQP